jgi:hypothetical protein
MAETKAAAVAAFDAFMESYEVKYQALPGEIDAGLAGGEQAHGRVTPTASFNRTAHPRLTKCVRSSPNFYS